jgi:hypothetical protein
VLAMAWEQAHSPRHQTARRGWTFIFQLAEPVGLHSFPAAVNTRN